MRKRDDEHASAIFGKAPAGGEGAGRGAEATAGGCLLKGSGGSKAAGSGGVVEPPAGPAPRAAAQLDQEALASVLEGRWVRSPEPGASSCTSGPGIAGKQD